MCQRVKERFVMTILKVLGTCVLFSILLITGNSCQNKPASLPDKQFVTTFAELSLLFEKEKMVNKDPDSLYQIKVHEFFLKKGTTPEAFKKHVDELSADNAQWKEFLQQATKTIDSIKTAERKSKDSTATQK
jgi:hypothetical protein